MPRLFQTRGELTWLPVNSAVQLHDFVSTRNRVGDTGYRFGQCVGKLHRKFEIKWEDTNQIEIAVATSIRCVRYDHELQRFGGTVET